MDGMGEVHLTEATEDSTYFGTSSNAAFIRQLHVALTQAQTAHRPSQPAAAFYRSSGNGFQGNEANKGREISPKRPRSHDIVAVSRSGLPPSGLGHHVPPEPEATNLLHDYFNTLGLFFPCIHPDAFLATYRQHRKNGFVGARRLWLALLYMMIASVYQCESPSSPTELTAEISESYFHWATELAMPEMLISSNLETGKPCHTNGLRVPVPQLTPNPCHYSTVALPHDCLSPWIIPISTTVDSTLLDRKGSSANRVTFDPCIQRPDFARTRDAQADMVLVHHKR